MKKDFVLASMICLTMLGFQSFTTPSTPVDPVGTWSYKAPTAPEGYESGDLVIAKDKDAWKASLKFGDYEVRATNVRFEKETLTFTIFLEGENVSVKALFSNEEVKGKASYSEGDIEFVAKRKVVKK